MPFLFRSLIFGALALLSSTLNAQEKGTMMAAQIVDGDTIPVRYLPGFYITAERSFKTKGERQKFNRLKYNVKKVYPMAKMAGDLLDKYSGEIAGVETDRERKKYFKRIEEELKAEYMDDLEKMNTTQGHILVKLIDRETGESSYEIVQEFRGTMSAMFWQGISRIFDQNLKTRYDPRGEDKEIESIVLLIEAGLL